MNSKALSRTAFHGAVTIMYFCAILGYQKLPPLPHQRPTDHYAGRFKYLTFWNLIAHFVFFAISFLINFMRSPSMHTKITKLRDKFFCGIILPYGMFVFATFWILYSINRELIFPKILDPIFPAWLNHVSHTAILPVLLLEIYILRHRHPKRKDGMAITAAFGITYFAWVLYLALVKDIWPYPILYMLNWGQRIIFFGVGLVFSLLLYVVGEKINSFCWGDGVVFKTK